MAKTDSPLKKKLRARLGASARKASPSRAAGVSSAKKPTAPASRPSARSRGILFTLSLDRMTTGELEPFATCIFSDTSDTMARAVVTERGWSVVVTANHPGHIPQKYSAARVMTDGVVRAVYSASAIEATRPNGAVRAVAGGKGQKRSVVAKSAARGTRETPKPRNK